MDSKNAFRKMTDLQAEIDRHLTAAGNLAQEMEAIRPIAQEAINQLSQAFLTDKDGNPIDGALYWYRHQALVRIVGLDFLGLVPCQMVDLAKFEFQPSETTTPEVLADLVEV